MTRIMDAVTGTHTKTGVGVYARYSTDRQDARSIEDQIRRCRAFAESRGFAVVAEHSDAAISGATRHRPGLQRLLAQAEKGEFRAVLVDDLSRLSRDLGDSWQIVFRDLAVLHVAVIDCTTGMASDAPGARLTFGANALVNDHFLQLVRAETHRGLERRAIDGFHTGGRCFGYATQIEENPPDPAHPRAVIRVNPAEADIVRRIFRSYADGESLGSICEALNRAGIEAPYDRDRAKRAGRGWSKNQIHSLLRNDRYLGRLIWNRREFYKHPSTGTRRSRLRDRSEWKMSDRPELAIVPLELWDAVQRRHRTTTGRGRPFNSGRKVRLLSGFLRCGDCGASMGIVSARNGWSNYGCSAHHGKGASICPNNRTISETRVTEGVLSALLDHFRSPTLREEVAAAVRAATAAKFASGDTERVEIEAQVRAKEIEVEKIAATLVQVGVSDTLRAMLARSEEQLRTLRGSLAAMTGKGSAPPLDVDCIVALVDDVQRLARANPANARTHLARLLDVVLLKPDADGWAATLRLQQNETVAGEGDRVVDKSGCGGRI